MFRQGRNPKEQTHTADDTADHTPSSASSYGGTSAQTPGGPSS